MAPDALASVAGSHLTAPTSPVSRVFCISQAFPLSPLFSLSRPLGPEFYWRISAYLSSYVSWLFPSYPLHDPLSPVTMPVPSVGDILMISQVAWKIGRAFSVGRKDAPAEFVEVEMGISGLAKALKLLAEALHAESEKSLFQTAAKKVQDGISTMLASCRRTVNDLDSMIGQYQVIRKHQTAGGFAIERSWSDLVLAEYRTMMWTMDGGNLQNLRDLLQMHTISVTLLIQALQRSIKRWVEGTKS